MTVLKTSLQFVLRKWADLNEDEKREYILQTLLEVEKLESAIQLAEQVAQEVDESIAVLIEEESASSP